MTYPTAAVVTTNLDGSGDSPATARSDLLDAVQKLNEMIAHTTAFAATLLDDANAAAARATLGSTTVGDAVFIAASAAAARTALGAAASGTNADITAMSSLTSLSNANTIALLSGTSTAGTGIAFPATASLSSNANTLDDYEEGTWTPGIRFGGGTTGITYDAGSQSGVYTKIGNVVTCTGTFSLSSKGSSTGTAQVTGLPFTAKLNSVGPNYIPSIFALAVTATGSLSGYLVPTFSVVNLAVYNGTTSTLLTDASFAAGSSISLTIVYQTNS